MDGVPPEVVQVLNERWASWLQPGLRLGAPVAPVQHARLSVAVSATPEDARATLIAELQSIGEPITETGGDYFFVRSVRDSVVAVGECWVGEDNTTVAALDCWMRAGVLERGAAMRELQRLAAIVAPS
jgi:hypothetical protein